MSERQSNRHELADLFNTEILTNIQHNEKLVVLKAQLVRYVLDHGYDELARGYVEKYFSDNPSVHHQLIGYNDLRKRGE